MALFGDQNHELNVEGVYLEIYAMVGKYGWEVALRTLKYRDGAALGLPEPSIMPITYIKAEKIESYNYGGSSYVKQEYCARRGQNFSRGRGRSRGSSHRKIQLET